MKIRFGLVLTLSFGLAAAGCSSGGTASAGGTTAAPTPGAEVLRQGERPRQNEDTRTAQRALEDAGEAESEAQATELYEQALAAADRAIAADSTNPLPWRQGGFALMSLDRFEEADEYLTRAEELRPIYMLELDQLRERAWIGLYQEAVPAVNNGQYQEAVDLFEQANAIYDKRPEVMITLGQIYAQLREHEKALENFDRAVEIINSDAVEEMDSATAAQWEEQAETIPLARASVLADAGRFEEAVPAFRELAAEHPEDVMIKRNLGAILIQTGDTAQAFDVYEELMQMPDLPAQEYYAVGVGFYQGSDYERAAEAFSGAAEQSPMNRDAIEMWARSLQIDSIYEEIPPVAERWVELDPNNRNARLILAQASNQIGDAERAREMVQSIEQLEVWVENLQLTSIAAGGAQVNGQIVNKTREPGSEAALTFTFYDDDGNPIGTATERVTLPEVDMRQPFSVRFDADQQVSGYGYEMIGGM